MRNIFAFRYLVCLNCNFENKIDVRPGNDNPFPISCRETAFSLDNESNTSRIPKSIIKRWFNGSDEILTDTAKELIADRDITFIKFKIQDIINTYESGRHMGWCNSVYDKMLMVKNI